jgi:hypothetical protein
MSTYISESEKEWRRKANKAMKSEGLRLAKSDESGWYYTVVVDGEGVQVWATDSERPLT